MIYGARWTSNYGERDDGTWAKGLHGITPAQIAGALGRCVKRSDPWPPTLPEFRTLCFPSREELGLPDLESAYIEAARFHESKHHKWSHPAVYHASKALGHFQWKQRDQVTRPIFTNAYEQICRRAIAGESFADPVPAALPAEVHRCSPEVALKHIDRLKQICRGSA